MPSFLTRHASEIKGTLSGWGRSVRALNPLADEDAALLAAVNRGEFTLQGFRNADLRDLLFEVPPSDAARAANSRKPTELAA